jgi:hypothetical protein
LKILEFLRDLRKSHGVDSSVASKDMTPFRFQRSLRLSSSEVLAIEGVLNEIELDQGVRLVCAICGIAVRESKLLPALYQLFTVAATKKEPLATIP